jgi:hypothetical protein
MRSILAAAVLVGCVASTSSAAAEESRTWGSTDTFSDTPVWWSVQLEERLVIGEAKTAMFTSSQAVGFGIGIAASLHLDHHWSLGLLAALDFPVGPDIATTYAAVNGAVSGLDTTLALRVQYDPLALSWMSLGLVVDVGLTLDSTTVKAGGDQADGFEALGAITAMAQLAFFPHDAFEVGLRGGYRYLIGDRVALDATEAARLHVPVGPYRGNGDGLVMLYEALHF